jgi:hypothetical protein
VRNKLLARLALGVVATASLLAPQAASALGFTFSFEGVTGLIQNLVDNQINACNGTDSCVVEVTGGLPAAGLGTYTYTYGTGFTVSGGVIQEGWGLDFPFWIGVRVRDAASEEFDFFGSAEIDIFGSVGTFSVYMDALGQELWYGSRGPVSFAAVQAPSPSVPGPLPLFGAAAAFGLSRKLRKSIKDSANCVSSSYTI